MLKASPKSLAVSLILLSIQLGLSQVSTQFKDSLRLEELLLATGNSEMVETEGAINQLSEAYAIVDSLQKQNPNSSFYLRKKASVLGRQAYFLSREGSLEEGLALYTEFIKIKKELGLEESLEGEYTNSTVAWRWYERMQRVNVYYDSAQSNMHKNPELAAEGYKRVIGIVDSLSADHKGFNSYFSKQANAYRVLGSYAAMDNKSVEALEYQEKSLNIKRRIGERESQVLNYKAISSNWGNSGDYEKAGIAADSAYRIAKETNSSKYLSEAARGKATFFRATQVPDSADHYFKIAVATADMTSRKVPKYAALDMYGRFLREQGKIKESLPYVNQFLDAIKSNKDTIFYTSVYLTIGESELALGNPQKAIQNFIDGIYYAKETNQRDELVDLYNGLAQSYEASGQYKKALETNQLFFEAYKTERDTSAYRARAEVALKNKYALQKAVDSTAFAQQKLLDESELKRKANTRFWAIASGLLMILGILLFVYLRNRQKVKEQAYQNILLNKKVATKTEEINELLNETIQHIKSKEKIAENLQKLSKQEGDITLKSIIADINASKADNSKLILVKENIEKVNYEFIKRLKQAHPSLTKTDIEICSFIRIGLRRKEVANLRNTSLEAVKSSRFRLKKKLHLATEASLDDYINSL